MPVLELETPEAKYINDMVGDCHFAIDCACGGSDGRYSGSHYKNADEPARKMTNRYVPRREISQDHTFLLNQSWFTLILEAHVEDNHGEPLIIVCDDCTREFPFTLKSYWDLHERMMIEYNRRSMEEEKPLE